MASPPVRQEYMEIEQAGQYIGIVRVIPNDPDPNATRKKQLQRVYHMVHRGIMPHYKIGKRLFFSKTAIDAWMQSGARDVSA